MIEKKQGVFPPPVLPNNLHHNQYHMPVRSNQMESASASKISNNISRKNASITKNQEHSDMHKNTARKRSKACTNCRKSKVKCVKLDSDAVCKRCRAHGLRCVYEFKIASYKVVGDGSVQSGSSDVWNTPQQISPPLLKSSFSAESKLPLRSLPLPRTSSSLVSNLSQPAVNNLNPARISDFLNSPTKEGIKSIKKNNPIKEWQNSVNGRLEEFDSKLENIMNLLTARKEDILSSNSGNLRVNKREREDTLHLGMISKRSKIQAHTSRSEQSASFFSSENTISTVESDKLLDDIITKDQARDLLDYFNANISTQLFGFNIKDYTVDSVWSTCPLLMATICCISSIHHPLYAHLFTDLESLVRRLSQNVLFKMPKDEMEAFNTVMALCFCGFWFQDHQMFTGLAIQLAKSMRLVSPQCEESKISGSDRVKLWYLLYILDGEQSMVFNRQSIVSDNYEFLNNGKKLLLRLYKENEKRNEHNRNKKVNDSGGKIPSFSTDYSDLRLISQVEYHQAIDSVFGGNAWGLLTPTRFGLPFHTNLELDRWMVQWTVLLSPMKDCSTWSSKSTLIYYNFAKMHINSTIVRRLQIVDSQLPDLNQCNVNEAYESSDDASKEFAGKKGEKVTLNSNGNRIGDTDDSSDDESLEEVARRTDTTYNGIVYTGGSRAESKKFSGDLALSAAETVLKFVLGDAEIVSSLKYAPLHIHIMLYYAALLILRPPAYMAKFQDSNFEQTLESLRLVKNLRLAVINNLPTDREFARRLVDSLSNILKEKYLSVRRQIEKFTGMSDRLDRLENVFVSNDNPTTRKKHIKVIAWPGYDSGHPDLEMTK